MRRSPGVGVLAVLLAVTAAGCGDAGSEDAADDHLQVTATTPIVADLVRNVGGSDVEVRQLLPPGADPHEHEPRPSDAAAAAESVVVFRSGGDLDAWLAEIATPEVDEVALLDSLSSDDRSESHWWHDPRNAVTAVRAITDALVDADPAGAPSFRRRAAAYVSELRRLDHGIERCIERVPAGDRELVTSHDSFGAFADRYDVREAGTVLPARATQAQPSLGEIADLADRLERNRVAAVFPEPDADPGLERAIAGEAGAELGAPLWGDSLGPPGSSGATYVDAMSANAVAMVEGFTSGGHSC